HRADRQSLTRQCPISRFRRPRCPSHDATSVVAPARLATTPAVLVRSAQGTLCARPPPRVAWAHPSCYVRPPFWPDAPFRTTPAELGACAGRVPSDATGRAHAEATLRQVRFRGP